MVRLGVFGAGAFGSALAVVFSETCLVSMFTSFTDHAESLKRNKLLYNITIDLINNVQNYQHDYILWCYPVAPSEKILKEIKDKIDKNAKIILCAKGMCENTCFLSDIFALYISNKLGVLSGPNFAIDLLNKKFSVSVVAFSDIVDAQNACIALSNNIMHILPSKDVIGLQIAGAVKNVIAIAGGIIIGMQLGQNALASLLTFGLAEMAKIGQQLGADVNTFYGQSGMGDLILTASSETSRNVAFGKMLVTKKNPYTTIEERQITCEGVSCISHIIALCEKYNINAPICSAVYKIINYSATPQLMLDTLKNLQ